MQALDELVQRATSEIETAATLSALDAVRVAWLGKKGTLTQMLKQLGSLPPEQRPAAGQQINTAKTAILTALDARRRSLEQDALAQELSQDRVDVTLPGRGVSLGGRHPVAHTMARIERIFRDAGFGVRTGPEIEDDYHNFTALNIPKNHPARALHDTFYFLDGKLLRTHTSPVQIRSMVEEGAPIRIISFANLKAVLHQFVESFFERDASLRFRPSYFPFTEPSAEVDVLWGDDRWLEILGCGMVHPNVLRNAGIDPEEFTGYAFGMGVERLAMLRYEVRDLRTFFENDLRFLRQFH
jgi:phenylalanyl-tRNA synthetase alpha chain